MKTCHKCGRTYDDPSLNFCLDDGEWLIDDADDGDPTRSLTAESDPGDAPTQRKIVNTDETAILPTGAIKHGADTDGKRFKASHVIAGIAVVLLLAGGYGLYVYFRLSPGQDETNTAPEITIKKLTGDGRVRQAAISPDGKFLAYLEIENNEKSIQVKQIETNSTVEILKAGDFEDIDNIAFSPDGNFVYFAGTDGDKKVSVYKVATLGGSPIRIPISTLSFSISPDGKKIAYFEGNPGTAETSILVANLDGSGAEKIIRKEGKLWIDGGTAWSPDGRKLLVAEGDDGRTPAPLMSLAIYSFDDKSLNRLGDDLWEQIDQGSLVWDAPGEFAYFSASRSGGEAMQIYRVSIPGGDAVQLTNDDNYYLGLSITADGTRLVTTAMEIRSGIWVSPDQDPMNAVEVLPARGDTWSLDWTPDGRIVYVSDQSGAREVWVMNPDASNQKQLTNDRVPKSEPVVSPDGKIVIYSSPVEGSHIYKVSIEGGDPTRIETGEVGPESPVFSADGKYIAFNAWPDGKQSVFRIPVSGGSSERLTNDFSREPSYSPDGTMIACFFIEEEEDRFLSLGIFPSSGGPVEKRFSIPATTIGDRGALWTPDGRKITYLVREGEKTDLWAQPVDGGEPERLTDFDRPWIQRRAYSRDGSRIAITRGESFQNAVMLRLSR